MGSCAEKGLNRYLAAQLTRYFLRELVRPGGLVVLEGCHWPSVATAVRYFELNTGWELQQASRATRLRAFRLPDPRTEPSFESFTPFQV